MSTFTIRISSSATNADGQAYGQQPDQGAPSYFDVVISGSGDPGLPNGVYDGYCLNPQAGIFVATDYSAQNYAGNSAASYVPIGFNSLTQAQVDQINWLLSQNFTSDAKFGGQYNYGEVQTAIWKLLDFSDASIAATPQRFLTDNGRNVVSASDADFLVNAARAAVASGNGVLPTDAFFSTILDPQGNIQPLILQLQKGKLGNFVWEDIDRDGVQDANEQGVDRVVVELYDGNGNFIASTITGDDFSTAAIEHGYYQFAGLKAGDYQVKFIAPSHDFTVQDAGGDDAADSDANALTGLSQVVTLAYGESNQTIDAGLVQKQVPASSISGYVYEDFGNDGVRAPGEPAIGGVTVTLTGTDDLGQPVSVSTTTDANGFYEFTGLRPGTYTVTETQPGAYQDGTDTAGSAGGTAGNDVISGIVLASGVNSTDNNFGELVGAQIRGFVYCDDNNDGIKQAGEVGLGGVTVTLAGTDDRGNAVTASTTTAADGSYIFVGLRPGTYSVTEATQPADKLDGKDTAGFPGGGIAGNEVISNIVLTQGLISSDNNFGEVLPAKLSGFVYVDAGDDGVKGAGETPIAGVTVTLSGTDDRGQPVSASTTTDANGFYEFTGLRPGTYSVSETQPVAYTDGKDTAGTSGGTVANDIISDIVLGAGANSQNNNFGELPAAGSSIAGVVYCDDNNDGIRQAGEVGLGGVTVRLTGTDNLGQPVDLTTTTNPDGSYSFGNLRAGTYTVTEVDQPAGKLDGKDTAGTTGGTAGNDVISNIVLGTNQASTGNNFGEVLPARLSGYVYEDFGNDGVRGAGEPPIGGVTVTLTGTDDLGQPVSASTTTDANGFYEFNGLRPGSYTVTETQPGAYQDGTDTAGSAGGTAGNDVISGIVLTSGANSTDNNFGELVGAQIRGFVYCDDNNDGIKQAGEVGLGGVTVTLTGTDDRGNAVTASTTSGADGSYIFAGLRPGTYSVTEATQPADKLDGKDTAGFPGGGTAGNEVISGIVLTQGLISSDNNFGEILPAQLSGYVYVDAGNDGVKGAGETPIGGVTVTLSGTDDRGQPVTATTTTNPQGFYEFTGLRPGTYTVTETQPSNYADGKDTAGTTGGTAGNDVISSIVLASGANSQNNNFGELPPAGSSIAGVVYCDDDNDGVRDAGEVGLGGVTVRLTGTNDLGQSVNLTTTTAADGSYSFGNLRAGTYTVTEVDQPAGKLDGKDTAGTTGGTAGNDVINGITLGTNQASTGNNFGEILPAVVKGVVYCDDNNDGVQQPGEVGLGGVTVRLTGTDDLGQPVSRTLTTNPDGSYAFTGLRPGTYAVTEVDQPAGKLDGKDSSNTPGATVGNDTVTNIVLNPGQTSVNNFGEVLPAKLSGYVYVDAGNDGVKGAGENGISGVTVTLTGTDDRGQPVSLTRTTDANGFYEFTGLRPGSYTVTETQPSNYADGKDTAGTTGGTAGNDVISSIVLASGANSQNNNFGELSPKSRVGDFVWEDKNGNGLQDAGEAGIAGVTVQLKNTAGVVIQTTTTDANGAYGFNVDAGTYAVNVVAPTGYLATGKDANANGSDATDSDIGSNGQTDNFTVGAGQSNLTIDAGLYKAAQIGNFIWYDKDADGIQDAGEAGIAGVTVELRSNGVDGVDGGSVLATTVTNASGQYLFSNLKPGDYHIDVVESTLPAGFVFTRSNVGANDAVDSDVRATAAQPLGWGIMANTSLTSGESDLTWDAGVYKVGIDVEKYVSGTTSSTGNNGGSEGGSCSDWVSRCSTTSSWQWSLSGWKEIKTPTGWSGVSGCTGKESFNQIFGCNMSGGTKSIYDILCGTGTGSADKFMRESVAAYLNACHGKVDYAYSKDQVVAHTQWGVSSGKYDDCSKSYERENTKGCDWGNDKSNWSCVVDTQLYDADAPPGLEVKTGSTVTFTYIVKNTGDTALKNVVLTDDRIATVTYIGGDTDKDGLLDTNETWTFTAKEVASAGTIKNTGTVVAVDSVGGTSVTDQDDAYYTGTGALKSSIGDRVWEDKDADGIQDSGEAGLAGVKVVLTGAGKDGVFGTKDDITATTTTNANGLYEFNNLDAGKYTVTFQAGNGYLFTKANQGANDAMDSDVDSSGKTGVITLDANEHDLTVDAGLYRKASVGDKVWEDSNHNWVQDAGEAGIANVTVKLLDAAGAVVATTKTNSTGNYLFSNLDPGAYTLQFDKTNVSYKGINMNNWKWAVKDQGSNDAIDSDVTGDGKALTNVTKTSQFTLDSGENDMTRDAGITPIVIDLNGDGIHTVSRANAQGSFDLLGTGKAIVSGWLSGNDGFLAVDTNGNGKIDGINELFGGNNKGDGFAKLASFDSNGDGLVNDLDSAFGQLLIWRDADGNHQTDAGELMSLADAGVASLGVAYTELPQLDENGNLHLERSTATMADGQSVAMTDVYFNVSAADAAEAGVTLPSMSDLLGNDSSLDALLGGAIQSVTDTSGCAGAASCDASGEASEALRRLAAMSRDASSTTPAAA